MPPQILARAGIYESGQAAVRRRADDDRGCADVVGVVGDQPPNRAMIRGAKQDCALSGDVLLGQMV
jgi:hypothetical protein